MRDLLADIVLSAFMLGSLAVIAALVRPGILFQSSRKAVLKWGVGGLLVLMLVGGILLTDFGIGADAFARGDWEAAVEYLEKVPESDARYDSARALYALASDSLAASEAEAKAAAKAGAVAGVEAEAADEGDETPGWTEAFVVAEEPPPEQAGEPPLRAVSSSATPEPGEGLPAKCASAGTGFFGWVGRIGDDYRQGLRSFRRGDWKGAAESLAAVASSHECAPAASELLPVARIHHARELWAEQGWNDEQNVREAQAILARVSGTTANSRELLARWRGPISWGTRYDDLYYALGTTNIRANPTTDTDVVGRLNPKDAVQLGPTSPDGWSPLHAIHRHDGGGLLLDVGTYDRAGLATDTMGFVYVSVLTRDRSSLQETRPRRARQPTGRGRYPAPLIGAWLDVNGVGFLFMPDGSAVVVQGANEAPARWHARDVSGSGRRGTLCITQDHESVCRTYSVQQRNGRTMLEWDAASFGLLYR